jgi:hypothetical protein
MILRGLFLLGRGRKTGMNEFNNSLEGFNASLAPLIAFPLVGSAISAVSGDWKLALVAFLSRLCAVLVLPVIVYEYARMTGRLGQWLKVASALNWSFWMAIPMLFVAAVIGAMMVETGLDMQNGEVAAIALLVLYLVWLQWFIMRTGLEISMAKAGALVVFSSSVIALVSAAPWLIDLVYYGKIVNY